jgi:hypothetical protein
MKGINMQRRLQIHGSDIIYSYDVTGLVILCPMSSSQKELAQRHLIPELEAGRRIQNSQALQLQD